MDVRTPSLAELDDLQREMGPGPVVMVNLIKFKLPDGAQIFGEYARLTAPLMAEAQTEVVYSGPAGPSLSGLDWDMVALIRFPSIDAFCEMMGSDVYQNEAGPLRKAAIERTIWLPSRPHGA